MYDLVIITQLPSFYKVNLYNRIAERLSLKVFFIGPTSGERTNDFTSSEIKFDYALLNNEDFETREMFKGILRLRTELKSIKYHKILCTGWNLPEFIWVFMTHARGRNLLGLESTIMESTTHGAKGVMKKILLKRISVVLASGALHEQLLKSMGYKKRVVKTLGVGMINRPLRSMSSREFRHRFLYLGRLSPEKNPEQLLDVFKSHPQWSLTYAGTGPLKDSLKAHASSNVSFVGHIPNSQITELFSSHDVLVLPSLSETWGLVVEEALYHQMPVLISNRCGASELITPGVNGLHFDPHDEGDLEKALLSFNAEKYSAMVQSIPLDFVEVKDQRQVEAYVEAMR